MKEKKLSDFIDFHVDSVARTLNAKVHENFENIKANMNDIMFEYKNELVQSQTIKDVDNFVANNIKTMQDKKVENHAIIVFALGIYGVLQTTDFWSRKKMAKSRFLHSIKKFDTYKNQVRSVKDVMFETLKGFDDVISSQIKDVLIDSIRLSKSLKETAKNLQKLKNINKVRSKLIARTEMNLNYRIGTLTEIEFLEEKLGRPLRVIWVATKDKRVRKTHLARHGKSFKKEEAKRLIGDYNCRCTLKVDWKEARKFIYS